MKIFIKIVLVIVITVTTFSCGQPSEKKQDSSKTEQTVEHKDESENVLKLDNGNLWSANSETTDGIKNMIALMSSFTEKEDLMAYATLNQNLEQYLTQKFPVQV